MLSNDVLRVSDLVLSPCLAPLRHAPGRATTLLRHVFKLDHVNVRWLSTGLV
jgi:hypothetical protein